MRVLVVDESKTIRDHIKESFRYLGHEIIGEAASGYEAISKYEELIPDLVTMNISIPIKKGHRNNTKALDEILGLDRFAKIIMISSTEEKALISEAMKSGAKDFIEKPITKEKIDQSLKKIFPDGCI